MPIKEKIIKTLPALFVLFSIAVLTNILEQYLNLKLQFEMRSESISFFLIILLIVLLSLFSILLQQIVFLTQVERCQTTHSQYTLTSRFGELIRENLKAIGHASLWMFVFIVPGVIRWIQYSLLPFVVFLNPEYQNGEREALTFSRALLKKYSWTFYLFWFGFNCFAPIAISLFGGEYEYFRETPIVALIISFIESLVLWAWMIKLWDIYDMVCQKLDLKTI